MCHPVVEIGLNRNRLDEGDRGSGDGEGGAGEDGEARGAALPAEQEGRREGGRGHVRQGAVLHQAQDALQGGRPRSS